MTNITDQIIEDGANALIVALDEEAPRITSDKHHLFKFDHAVARRVFRRALEFALRHSDS
jgi:hypothetical protein